jgi:hypothetical protein
LGRIASVPSPALPLLAPFADDLAVQPFSPQDGPYLSWLLGSVYLIQNLLFIFSGVLAPFGPWFDFRIWHGVLCFLILCHVFLFRPTKFGSEVVSLL